MDDAHEPTNRFIFHRLEISVHIRFLHTGNWTFIDQTVSEHRLQTFYQWTNSNCNELMVTVHWFIFRLTFKSFIRISTFFQCNVRIIVIIYVPKCATLLHDYF